jgi:hypothetical protein
MSSSPAANHQRRDQADVTGAGGTLTGEAFRSASSLPLLDGICRHRRAHNRCDKPVTPLGTVSMYCCPSAVSPSTFANGRDVDSQIGLFYKAVRPPLAA